MGDVVLFAWFAMFLWALCSIHNDIQDIIEEEEENDGEGKSNETETKV